VPRTSTIIMYDRRRGCIYPRENTVRGHARSIILSRRRTNESSRKSVVPSPTSARVLPAITKRARRRTRSVQVSSPDNAGGDCRRKLSNVHDGTVQRLFRRRVPPIVTNSTATRVAGILSFWSVRVYKYVRVVAGRTRSIIAY